MDRSLSNVSGVHELSLMSVQRPAKRRGCLLSYSQAEPGRELSNLASPRLLAEPCISHPPQIGLGVPALSIAITLEFTYKRKAEIDYENF